MTVIVEVPGHGEVEFPDGMSESAMAEAIRKNFNLPAPKQAVAPMTANPTEGMSGTQRFLAGTGQAMTNLYRGAKQALGVGDQKALQAEINESRRLDAPLSNTGAGMAGNIFGGMATMLPAMAIPGVNTLAGSIALGAGAGALSPVADGESRLANSGLGAAGGAVGYGLSNLIGRAVTPVQNALTSGQTRAAEGAKAIGAKMTPGTSTGSQALQQLEASMSSFPVTAGPMSAIRGANQTVLNRAAAKAIGETADELTDDVLNAARSRIGAQFDKVAAIKEIPVDTAVANKLAAIETKYRGMLDKPLADMPVVRDVYNALGSKITGAQYHDWQSQINKIARSKFVGAKSDPNLGFALSEVKNALDDAASAVLSGAERDAFKTAQQQWRNLVMLEAGGVTNEVAGNVSPRMLANVLSRKDKQGFRLGGNSSDLYNMARFSKAFPQVVGDSGTATRAFLPWALGAGVAGGAGTLAGGGDVAHGVLGGMAAPLAMGLLARGGQAAYLSPVAQAYMRNQLLGPASRSALSQAGILGGISASQSMP